jgi:hypothetical protein
LILFSDNINLIGHHELWTTGHTLEENFNDTDSYELDDILTQAILFTHSTSLAEQKFLFKENSNYRLLTHSFIRAPPKYTV